MAARLDNSLSPIAPRRYPIPMPGSDLLTEVHLAAPSVCFPDVELALYMNVVQMHDLFTRPGPLRLKPVWKDYSWEAEFALEKE